MTNDKGARAARLKAICLSLPEAVCEPHGEHAAFQVRKRNFAWYVASHHGDGIHAVWCKVLPGDNAALISAHPERFYLPAYMGTRGWVALRLDLKDVDWEEVKELVSGSYRLVAPKARTAKPAKKRH